VAAGFPERSCVIKAWPGKVAAGFPKIMRDLSMIRRDECRFSGADAEFSEKIMRQYSNSEQ